MAIESPKIDKNGFETVIKKITSLAPYYVPEWSGEEKEAGLVLSKIFSSLMEKIIYRLNQVPKKNFIAYLERLGIKLLPARSSSAPVTFTLSDSAKEHVLVPEKTRIAAKDVVFETGKNMLAAPAKLIKAYGIDVSGDAVYESPPDVIAGGNVIAAGTSLLYDAKKQDGAVYVSSSEGISKGDMLIIGKSEYAVISEISDLRITLSHKLDKDHQAGSTVEKVITFELFEGKNLQEHVLYLGHNDILNLNGKAYILIGIKPFIKDSFESAGILWEYWGEDDNKNVGWHNLNIKQPLKTIIDLLEGIFNIDVIVLEKDKIGEIKKHKINKKECLWIRCRVKDKLLKEDLLSQIKIDYLLIASLPWFDLNAGIAGLKGIQADAAFYNDIPLELSVDNSDIFKTPLYPLGNTPRIHDTFYIASKEAFSKKGANIILKFDINNGFKLPVEKVHGIGKKFTRMMKSADINTVEELLKYTPKKLAGILKTKQINTAVNILEAAKKEFHDKTGFASKAASGTDINEDLRLSWEYWNGKGWQALNIMKDETDRFLQSGDKKVEFNCPVDLEKTEVSGQENYWIRTRIISGDYGKEKFVKDATNDTWIINTDDINPPIFDKLSIIYFPKPRFARYCFAYNNLVFKDFTEEGKNIDSKSFSPFIAPDDDHQGMYLGFDKKLEKGPICVFFSIEEQLWGEKLPIIEWEYYAEGGKWTRLEVVDETMGFTQSGVIEFVFKSDYTMTERFGKELYWIRAVDVKDSFKPINLVYAELYSKYQYSRFSDYIIQNFLLPAKGIYKHMSLNEAQLWNKSFIQNDASKTRKPDPCKESYTQIEPCPEYLNVYHPQWAHNDNVKKAVISPKIRGIFLNTTWAVQTETVKDELLGSSDGTADQGFSIRKTPVISEEIWVNEIGTLTENGQKEIIEKGGFETKEIKDEKGKLTEFWIKWEPVEDLLSDSPYDRHYEMDGVSGEVVFGNGINGKIPPTGSDNIKANYQTGGGIKGNVDAYKIKDQRSSVQYIDKIFNPLPADGGTDVEPVDETAERGPKILKHRNRAVTAEDFEQMAYQASRAIAKAKCLPDFNDKGEFKTGWVTVIVIQKTSQDRPKLSLQMKKKVESYLRERTANTVIEKNRLQVSEPVYIEVVINASLKATSSDFVPLIERDAIAKLKEFLHPLSGGYEKKGWEFGSMPCFSDYYAILEGIDGVDYVRNISLTLRTYSEDKIISEFIVSSEGTLDTEIPPYAMIYSGNHKINAGI